MIFLNLYKQEMVHLGLVLKKLKLTNLITDRHNFNKMVILSAIFMVISIEITL